MSVENRDTMNSRFVSWLEASFLEHLPLGGQGIVHTLSLIFAFTPPFVVVPIEAFGPSGLWVLVKIRPKKKKKSPKIL